MTDDGIQKNVTAAAEFVNKVLGAAIEWGMTGLAADEPKPEPKVETVRASDVTTYQLAPMLYGLYPCEGTRTPWGLQTDEVINDWRDFADALLMRFKMEVKT